MFVYINARFLLKVGHFGLKTRSLGQILETPPTWKSNVLHRIIQQKPSKFFSSQTTSHRAQIFGMQHCIVDLYQDCPNYVPRIKISSTLLVSCFTQKYIVKSSSTKPQALKLRYLVCSIVQWTSTKIAQITSLESKLAPPQWSAVLHRNIQ